MTTTHILEIVVAVVLLVVFVVIGAFVYLAVALYVENYGEPESDDDYFLGRRREDIENDNDE